MFSLIITIVSIALVVALVAATMNHGGDTLTQGRTSADASAFVNAGQQISSAAMMYQAFKGATPTLVTDLTTNNYLSSQPVVKSNTDGEAFVLTTLSGKRATTVSVKDATTCYQINLNAGFDDATSKTADQAAVLLKPFGCDTTASPKTFIYKY